MRLLQHLLIHGRVWRSLWIFIAILSLTGSLATRFYVSAVFRDHATKSAERRSVEPTRQHLDRDAFEWPLPTLGFTSLQAVVIDAVVAHSETPPSVQFLSDSLYNRPPPAFEYL